MVEIREMKLTSDERVIMDAILKHALLVRPISLDTNENRGVSIRLPKEKRRHLNALEHKGWIVAWTLPIEDAKKGTPLSNVYVLLHEKALDTYRRSYSRLKPATDVQALGM